MDEIDVSNDPEVERLGANVSAQHALSFWKRLAAAARRDGARLDPLWENDDSSCSNNKNASQQSTKVNTTRTTSAYHTTRLVLTESMQEDVRLYKRFRSNFGHFPVQTIQIRMSMSDQDDNTTNINSNPLGGEKWTWLLLASEGLIDDFNFMTLLRSDAHDMFWMTENDACDGLLIVPRAQFLYLELARIQEGVYNRTFRRRLQVFDFKTQSERLEQALSAITRIRLTTSATTTPTTNQQQQERQEQETVILDALHQLRTQWPCPRQEALRQTHVLPVLRRGSMMQGATSETIRTACHDLLQYWQDMLDLGRIPKLLLLSNNGGGRNKRERMLEALRRAGTVYTATNSSAAEATSSSSSLSLRKHTLSPAGMTRTTSSLPDLMIRPSNDNNGNTIDPVHSSRIFGTHGICIFNNSNMLVDPDTLQCCRRQAQTALQELQEEQLTPRGLLVDGDNAFDFTNARQRPGHRVDNRRGMLDRADRPIAALSRHLLTTLPPLLFHNYENDPARYEFKILYGGVVHSFPRQHEKDPPPPAQGWHRDGPSLFHDHHHETHCFNVFVPLIDVDAENGTTEFLPGTHDDVVFERLVGEAVELAKRDATLQHPLAVRANVSAGSCIVFDVRLLHRGLSNASLHDRPVLYFTMARDWFVERHMFQQEENENESSSNHEKKRNKKKDEEMVLLARRAHQLVTGTPLPPATDSSYSSYGHPHYTTRFDLLLLEGLDDNMNNNDNANFSKNLAAILAFAAATKQGKDAMVREWCERLGPQSYDRKYEVLRAAQEWRRQSRRRQDEAVDVENQEDDFASIAADMSDVAALYKLTATILFEEGQHLLQLGFSKDQQGVCILLAMLKAYAQSQHQNDDDDSSTTTTAMLEETFSSWWHAGRGRFALFPPEPTTPPFSNSNKHALVIFSSLGSGLARPEWNGTLTKILQQQQQHQLDVWHVLDPAYSWYCQDPTCRWKGGLYYEEELKKRLEKYQRVMFLGDSMGAAAALRFGRQAHVVLAFTPQVDIVSYPAITRRDFRVETKREFERELITAVEESTARMVIHYGRDCQDDVRHVERLPRRANVKLVAHDFDDHILSLHLRDLGQLEGIVCDEVCEFLQDQE